MLHAGIHSRFAPLAAPSSAAPAESPDTAPTCVTCGRPADTPFSPQCGERRAARSLVVVIVPAYAALIAMLQLRRRKSALHHLAFGFHAIAALLVIVVGGVTVALPLEFALRRGWLRLDESTADFVTSTPLLLLFWAWLVLGMCRAYGDARWSAAIKGAALAAMFGVVLVGYRALLFFTAFWAT